MNQNPDLNLNSNIDQLTNSLSKRKNNDIRRRFDDDIEIAKEFEPPFSNNLLKLSEQDEKRLLKHYQRRKNKK